MDENRTKALSAALSQIEKQFGKGSVMRLGDSGTATNIEAVSTGSIGLDVALGIGGVPKGRVVEIYGPESSGKTTLTLQIVAEAQKTGGTAAFVDAEHALDPAYAGRFASAPIPKNRMPDVESLPGAVYRMIHDELLLEVDEDRAEEVGTMVREEMCSAMELAVRLVVDLGTGANWDEAH